MERFMPDTPIEKLYFSVQEAAQALSLSRPHLYRLVKRGDIAAVKFGSRVLIPRDEIQKMEFEPYPVTPGISE